MKKYARGISFETHTEMKIQDRKYQLLDEEIFSSIFVYPYSRFIFFLCCSDIMKQIYYTLVQGKFHCPLYAFKQQNKTAQQLQHLALVLT